jgi:excisionase family DNA binding protein
MSQISAREAAEKMGISKVWLIELVKRGAIKGHKVGSYYVIDQKSVEAYKARKPKNK